MATRKEGQKRKPREEREGMERSLFDIGEEIRERIAHAMAYAEEHDGELPDEFVEWFGDGGPDDFEEKAERVARQIIAWEAEADVAKAERERIQSIERVLRNRAKSLRDYLRLCLSMQEVERIERPTVVISRRATAPKLVVVDESEVPAEYVVCKTTLRGTDYERLREIAERERIEIAPDKVDIDTKSCLERWKATNGEAVVPGTKVERGETIVLGWR